MQSSNQTKKKAKLLLNPSANYLEKNQSNNFVGHVGKRGGKEGNRGGAEITNRGAGESGWYDQYIGKKVGVVELWGRLSLD